MDNLRHDDTLMVLDTGATAHVSKTLSGFIANRRQLSSEIFGNHGEATPIIKLFDKAGILHNKINKPVSRLVLRGVNYAPASSFNLFAVSQSMKKGWKLYGNFNGFVLTRGASEIRFDIHIPSGSGYLWAARLIPDGKSRSPETHEMSNLAGENDDNDSAGENSDDEDDSFNDAPGRKGTTDAIEGNCTSTNNHAGSKRKYMCNGISKEYAHVLMGHANIRSALASVKYLKFRICNDTSRCRQVIACEGCARGKARKKGVSHIKATQANAFTYLDFSTIRKAGNIKVRNGVWVALVCENSGFATSLFVPSKHAMIEAVCELLGDWRTKHKAVKTIRCDNAKENNGLEKRAKSST